ncbi:hypothetical protein [Pseudarthrobacter sp. TAF60_1]|uniref:hypothetical protein n=1 Tax=Pseudarthrobacter sp. TAF60_1 TaxID=3233071 RepID=UPI003F976598
MLLFVDNHIGELRSAVQDWRELLPPDYVEDVIADDTTSPEPNSLSWKEFEKIYLDLAERSGKGALWGGYHPHFMVGVYPAGGMIGYLLWLQFGRRCPILVAPDPEAPQSTIEALATRVKALCPGQSQYRCLIVDASLKTGKSMATTKIMVQEMARSQDIDLEIRTLCLVEYPLQDKPVLSADFVGVRESVHLPFADA